MTLKVPKGVSISEAPEGGGEDTSWLDSIPSVGVEAQTAQPNSAKPAGEEWLNEIPDVQTDTHKAYDAVSNTNPDHNAKVLNYSEKLAEPPEFVDKHIDKIEQAANTPHPSFFAEMEANYPGSTSFYNKPENMAIGHDDMPNVVQHEDIHQQANVAHGVLSAFGSGLENSIFGMTAEDTILHKLPEPGIDSKSTMAERLAFQVGQFIPDSPFFLAGGVIGGAAGALTAPVTGPVGAVAGAGAGAFALPTAIRGLISEQYKNGDVKGLRDTWDRLYKVGTDATKQATVGAVTTLAGAATGGLGPIISTASEIGAMEVADAAVSHRDVSLQSLLENALFVGGLHAVGVGGKAVLDKYGAEPTPNSPIEGAVAEEQSVQTDKFLTSLVDTAAQSKIRTRRPEAWREHVENVTKDTADSVYIDSAAFKTFFQEKGEDPKAFADSLGATDSFLESDKTSGDIRIPLVDFIDKLVDKAQYRDLIKDAKLDPEHLSPNDVENRKLQIKETVEAQANASKSNDVQPEPETPNSSQAVFDNIKQQLIDSGRGKQEAETNARLFSEANRVRAEKLGVDPLELFQKENFKITNEAGSRQDALAQDKLKYEGNRSLDQGQAGVEKRFGEFLATDEAVKAYDQLPDTQGGKIISADVARDLAPEYAGSYEGRVVHTQSTNKPSAAFVEKLYNERIKDTKDGVVLFTAGGPASGKTTTLNGAEPRLVKDSSLVFDQIGAGEEGFKKKIDAALEGNNKVRISYVYQPINDAAVLAERRFGEMGRSIPAKEFVRLHVKSLDTILSLADKYKDNPNVKITAYSNAPGDKGTIPLAKLNELRYTNPGESTAEAIKRLTPAIAERFKNVEEEVKQKTAAFEHGRLRPEAPGGGIGIASEGRGGPQGQGSLNQEAGQEKLGSIEFGPEGSIVRLLSADKSTFAHESFHYFVNAFQRDVGFLNGLDAEKLTDVQRTYLDDSKKLLEFAGADSFESLTTDQQEKLARAGEQYLRDGKAPNEALRGVFKRFRDWLTSIYTRASDLKVELNPEIRGVFDRLLSTEEEIKRAEVFTGLGLTELENVPDNVRAKLRDMQEKARETAVSELLSERMKELDKKEQGRLNTLRDSFRPDAEAQVKEQPVFKAREELKQNGIKSPEALARAALNLEGGGKVKPEHLAHLEATAEVFGFSDGHALAEALVAAKENDTFNKQVKDLVETRLTNSGEIKTRGDIRDRAIELIHNEQRGELLALEKQVLEGLVKEKSVRTEATARNRAEAKVAADAAKAYARETLSKKPMKDAGNARIYITAERNSAARVAKALAKKDYAAAAKAKEEQLANHALAAEAIKNRKEAVRILKNFKKFASRGRDLLEMPYGFTRQVDKLLSRYELAPKRNEDTATLISVAKEMQASGESSPEIANRTGFVANDDGTYTPETISQFQERVNDNYYSITLPESVLSGKEAPYRDIPISELRELHDAAKQIAGIGKSYNRGLGTFEKLDIKEAGKKFRAEVEESYGTPYDDQLQLGSVNKSEFGDRVDKLLQIPDAIIGDLVNVLSVVKVLAGGKDTSAGHDFIYRPIEKAEQAKIRRYEKMRKEVRSLFDEFYTKKELKEMRYSREAIPELGTDGSGKQRFLSKEEQVSMLLNWGNEGNRERIRSGYNLNDAQVEAIIGRLDKKHFDFAQKTWDYLNTFWPDVVKLEMDVNGTEPKKVESSVVRSPHGEYEGGYYPIAYDPEKSADAYRTEEQRNALYKEFSSAKAHTESGHAKARAARGVGSVQLSFDVLFRHLENVVHDLEYRKPIIDVNRFLSQSDVKNSLTRALGVKAPKAMEDWLKSMGSDQTESSGKIGGALRWLRFNATFATLAFRIPAFPVDVVGNMINASRELGGLNTVKSVANFLIDSKDTREFVEAKSERMKQRATMRDRDLLEMSRNLRGEDSALQHYAFYIQTMADEMVSVPLWKEIYQKNLIEHGEEKAGLIANEAIARRVGSGSKLDIVGAQKGSEQKKIFTMYYSYMSMMFNQAWVDGKMAGLEYNAGNHGTAIATMAKATLYLWLLQSVNENFWKEFLRNKNQDNEAATTKRVIARTINQPFGYVPLVRDIVPFILDQALGTQGNIRFSPAEQALETLVKPIAQYPSFHQGKHFDRKYSETVANAAAIALKYPQSLNTMAFNFVDWQNSNGEVRWRDAITKRTKK